MLDDRGLSTRAFAEKINAAGFRVSHQRIGQLRTGSYPRVDPQLALNIENALGVERGFLFEPNDTQP